MTIIDKREKRRRVIRGNTGPSPETMAIDVAPQAGDVPPTFHRGRSVGGTGGRSEIIGGTWPRRRRPAP